MVEYLLFCDVDILRLWTLLWPYSQLLNLGRSCRTLVSDSQEAKG